MQLKSHLPGADAAEPLQTAAGSKLLLEFAHFLSNLLPETRGFAIRRALFRSAGIQVGRGTAIVRGCRFIGSNIQIGGQCWIGGETRFYSTPVASIRVGNNVDIAPHCIFICGTHELGDESRRAGKGCSSSIEIGDGCWIGVASRILAGASIGRGSIVAAGSVVRSEEYAPNVLLAGVPATVKKSLPTMSLQPARYEISPKHGRP